MARLGVELAHEIVLMQDERIPIQDTTQAPYRWTCSLEVHFPEPVLYALGTIEQRGATWASLKPSRQGCGSGLLIGPGKVLTAAHVIAGLKMVHDHRSGKKYFKVVVADQVVVIPGRNEDLPGASQPFGQFLATKVSINPAFKTIMEQPIEALNGPLLIQALTQDYGTVCIGTQCQDGKTGSYLPGEKIGWWGKTSNDHLPPFDPEFRNSLQNAKVHILGYPGEKSHVACGALWRSFDRVVDAFPRQNGKILDLLLYVADTSAGMSGSPVWVKNQKGERYLVGVHSSFLTYGKQGRRVNVAALVTAKVFK
jgi:V8-like Glu-specific endopeptidase